MISLLIVAAEVVLLAALVLYARHRVRKNYRYPSPRHPARRAVRARGIPAGHPDSGYVLSMADGRAWTELMATDNRRAS